MAKVLSVDHIEDGLVLAEHVINNYGQILIAAGATLNNQHKQLLKTWNIQTVIIKVDDAEEEVIMSEEIRILCTEMLIKRFTWDPRNANERDLFQVGLLSELNSIEKKDIITNEN